MQLAQGIAYLHTSGFSPEMSSADWGLHTLHSDENARQFRQNWSSEAAEARHTHF